MNPSAWRTVAVALLLIAALTGAQAQKSGRDDKSAEAFLLLKLLELYAPKAAALAGKECGKTETICTIEMQLISVGGRDYCLAIAPDVMVQTEVKPKYKKIVAWKLSAPALGGKDFAFHSTSGILLTVNEKAQVEFGGPGDGTLISPPNSYHVWTKRNEPLAVAAYLPVILWGPPGKEELCAAIDPRIVNAE